MSLKGRLMPTFARMITSPSRRRWRRARLERKRRRRGRPHTVTFYCQVDDPYSYLLAQVLPDFQDRYAVEIVGRTVSAPPPESAPRLDLLERWGFRDCQAIAPYYGLEGPAARPASGAVDAASRRLLAAEATGDYLRTAREVGDALWRGEEIGAPAREGVAAALADNRAELHRRGHYLSGMLHYEGEWYWGIDRLPLLEERLAELGVGEGSTLERRSLPPTATDVAVLEVFLSVRSPYSYLALERVLDLARRYPVDLRLRPILPMVKRGLPVPRAKRRYIVLDVKREAERVGVPFGRICDPLPAVERILSIVPYAEREDREAEYLLSAMTGAWAEGIELATDRGLRHVVERAGLSWADAQRAMSDDSWRQQAAKNYADMEALGFWGVPTFRLGDFATWGQDRLWLLEERLRGLGYAPMLNF